MFKKMILLFCLGSLLTAGEPDYRIGLHTHMGYPRELADALDQWNEEMGRVSPQWRAMDTDALLAHAVAFRPTVLSHGGLSWDIQTQGYRLARAAETHSNELVLTSTEGLEAGSWLFSI